MAMHGYVCPVDTKICSGKLVSGTGNKFHQTEKELIKCKESELKSQGYVKIGTRAWSSPNNGPVLILDRHPGKASWCRVGKENRAMRQYHCRS